MESHTLRLDVPKSNSCGDSPSFTLKDENLENSLVNVTPKRLNETFKAGENIMHTPNMAGDNSIEALCNTGKNKLIETSIEHNFSWNGQPEPGFEQEVMLNELQELRDMLVQQEKIYTDKVNVLEEKIKGLEITLKDKDDKEQKLQKRVSKLSEGQEQINLIMEEYEKTISRLVAEEEQAKQARELEKENLIKERDTVAGHLANIEIAFSDLHKKYERCKDVIAGIKKNEEALKTRFAEYEATIKEQQQKYDLLKSYAMSQLESDNQELDSMRRSNQAENAKLNAMLKMAEVKVKSLEEMLEQKVKENEELASICDELISKVGSSD